MRVRRKWATHVTELLWTRQRGRCNMCREELVRNDVEKDHVVPLCCGGDDAVSNLQILCGSCHNIKTAEDRIRHQVEYLRFCLSMTIRTRYPVRFRSKYKFDHFTRWGGA